MKKEQKNKEWKEKYPNGKNNLAWSIDDYNFWEEEPPEKLLANPESTEGELMNQEDIELWVLDNFRAFCVIKEEDPSLFNKLHKDFIQDIKYLISLGKVGEELLDELSSPESFDF
jgi:hypothetical protein